MKMLAIILLRDFSLWMLLYWYKKLLQLNSSVVLISAYRTVHFVQWLYLKSDFVNALCGLWGWLERIGENSTLRLFLKHWSCIRQKQYS